MCLIAYIFVAVFHWEESVFAKMVRFLEDMSQNELTTFIASSRVFIGGFQIFLGAGIVVKIITSNIGYYINCVRLITID